MEMTETPEMSSCSESKDSDMKDDAPVAKKRKMLQENEQSEKLEHRLGGILCCAVCLDLPPAAVYQCTNGHLMCAPCFTHLLADARLRDEAATCPNCRVAISTTTASRNLAVEKTVSELPSECKFCTRVYPRHSLKHHEDNICEERRYKLSQVIVCGAAGRRPLLAGLLHVLCGLAGLPLAALWRAPAAAPAPRAHPAAPRQPSCDRVMGCKYACIGCTWRGPAHEAREHEAHCGHPARSAADLLALLSERERHAQDAAAVHEQILDLLSYEKITFNDLQLKPYHTEEFVHKLYYESSRFCAFGHQWVVKAFVNRDQGDPTQSAQRDITYQLILKSKTSSALSVQWVCVRGPWGEARMAARVAAHSFRDEAPDAPPLPLPLAEPRDANRLLAIKPLHCRLIMFLSAK